jgi:catechol 2,3-dioxygenase-like lactoylglutathione lyase family enzyme
MQIDLDHAHLFASDVDATIRWWSEMLGARVVFDLEVAGARNVRLAVGRGAINLYDQPPRVVGSGSVHHLGIQTDDLEALVASMEAKGFRFRQPITDAGAVKYVMAAAPDDVLLELFEAPGLKPTQ